MRLISLCKAGLAKWGQTSQLDKTVEEIGELIVAIKKVHFINNPPISESDGYRMVAMEVADVQAMFIQLRLMFPSRLKAKDISLYELEDYDYAELLPEHFRTMLRHLFNLMLAIEEVAESATRSRKLALVRHLDFAEHSVNLIKSTIPNVTMFEVRKEKAHKFANYLG